MAKTTTPIYEAHALALVFPRQTPDELESLAESIARNGQREDIVLLEGQILDGFSRYTAMTGRGLKPRFRDFGSLPTDGSSPAAYVNDRNLERRNLKNASQKAALAAKLLPFFQAEAEHKGGDALGKAAAATGASRSYTAQAATLTPENLDKVAEGQTTLPAALDAQKNDKEAQAAAKRAENKEIRDLRRDNREAVKETHGEEFAEAFDKGVVLKKLDDLKAFLKQDAAVQLLIAPLLAKQYSVKGAIKMMTGELNADDTIETLLCRALAHKGAKAFTVEIDGHVISVRKPI